MNIYKTIKLKLNPTPKQQQKLELLFEEVDYIWKNIVENSITDFKKVKDFTTQYLGSQFKQGLVKEFKNLLSSQRELKKIGKSGKIKYRRKYTVTHWSDQPIRLSDDYRKIYIQKFGMVRIYGHKQFKDLYTFKIVSVTLLKRATGYYIHLVLKTDPDIIDSKKSLGIDLGIANAITTSNGYAIAYHNNKKINKLHKRIARLQKALSRKIKGSYRFKKLAYLIRKAYENLSFILNNIHSQISSFLKKYHIVFQKELVKLWHQSYKSIRKRVQHTAIGRLLERLRWQDHTEISSNYPTTKTCFFCGNLKTIDLSERTYVCESCDTEMPRDVNSALNMLKFSNAIFDNLFFEFDQKETQKLITHGIEIYRVI